jgi:translation initiation factor IF-3
MEGTTLHAILAPSKKAEPAPKKPAAAPSTAAPTAKSAEPATDTAPTTVQAS